VVAEELAGRLRARGSRCEIVDMIEAAGPPGARLAWTYRQVLAKAPALYGAAMRIWARAPRLVETLAAATSGHFDRTLERAVRRIQPDVVVATYNLAGQALGRLVRRGRIGTPLVVYVTDPGAHPYWVSRSAALHLVITEQTAAGLRRAGAGRVEVVTPLLRPGAHPVADRRRVRADLRLPSGRTRICVVNGGSWAAGRLADTVRLLLRDASVTPVVLCGDNGRLAEAVRVLGAVPVPWTPDVLRYLSAADVVVDNAGGQTCLEALACGTPVVVYRPIPGHGRLNARTLAATGLATFARTPGALLAAVRDPVPAQLPACGHDPADAVLSVLHQFGSAAG
jgi:UDP-N-acetylglucosamine:LPS N-acetylglucosamine transferase